ncbi:putative Saposin B-type domain-containing protein [Seiridium cardinale]|uniref:Saposin B-type domain-containing protein n=1 Tax=Seiridium cardinale TaxID=138064 RepID=A0ABR2Y962_9PEZI
MHLLLFPFMLVAVHAAAFPTVSVPPGDMTRDLTTGSSGMLLDKYSESALEFHEWIGAMVDEGHLFYPNVTGDGLMLARSDSWYVKLKDVGCGQITGNRDLVSKTQTHFCGFVQKAEKLLSTQMETDVNTILCDDHRVCKLAVRAAFDFFNVFKNVDDVTNLCHEMFDALNKACPGGGVASAEVGDNNGGATYNGQLESSFALEDSSTCQQSATHECFQSTVPS